VADRQYLAKFLPEAKALIERSKPYSQNGQSAEEEPGKTFEERAAMFNVSIVDINGAIKIKSFKNAGWILGGPLKDWFAASCMP
jgi:hypothetical protein